MRDQKTIKILLVLLLSTAYMLGFSHFGALAFHSIIDNQESFPAGTAIGSVDLTNKTSAEAKKIVKETSEKWLENTKFTFMYKEKTVELKPDVFVFKTEETIKNIESGQKNLAFVDMKDGALDKLLALTSSRLLVEEIDREKLTADLLLNATMLEQGRYVFRMENYIPGSESDSTIMSKAVIDVKGQVREIESVLEKLPSVEILGKTQFSLLKKLEQEGFTKMSVSSTSMIATGIYEAILPTNFSIVERNISRELPSYARLGYEAKVDIEHKMDFAFSNLNDTPYTLEFSLDGDKLTVVLKGNPFLYTYSLEKEEEKSFEPNTIMQFSALIETGDSEIVEEGKQGTVFKLIRKTIDEAGKTIKEDIVSDDFYPPVHRVVVQSLQVPIIVKSPESNPVVNDPNPEQPVYPDEAELTELDQEPANQEEVEKEDERSKAQIQKK